MFKTLQASLQQYRNQELPDIQAWFRKDRRTRTQIADNCWIIGKLRELQKNIHFFLIEYTKTFDYVNHKNNCEKFLKKWEYQITFPGSWETWMQVKKQQIESDMEQWIVSKLGKEYV